MPSEQLIYLFNTLVVDQYIIQIVVIIVIIINIIYLLQVMQQDRNKRPELSQKDQKKQQFAEKRPRKQVCSTSPVESTAQGDPVRKSAQISTQVAQESVICPEQSSVFPKDSAIDQGAPVYENDALNFEMQMKSADAHANAPENNEGKSGEHLPNSSADQGVPITDKTGNTDQKITDHQEEVNQAACDDERSNNDSHTLTEKSDCDADHHGLNSQDKTGANAADAHQHPQAIMAPHQANPQSRSIIFSNEKHSAANKKQIKHHVEEGSDEQGQDAKASEIIDKQSHSSSSDVPSKSRVTKVVTVFKLSALKKQQQNKAGKKSANNASAEIQRRHAASSLFDLIMRASMQIQNHESEQINPVLNQNTNPLAGAPGAAAQHSTAAKDSQVQLYQEQDLKLALTSLSHQSGSKISIPKRRPRENYLQYHEVFDLNILLDKSYWRHKEKQLLNSSEEILRLSALNKLYHVDSLIENDTGKFHNFLDFNQSVDSENFKLKYLFWQNEIDAAVPYQSGFKDHYWNYIHANEIVNPNIKHYLSKAKRNYFCNCLDGCQNPRKCLCYKWNRKLQNPTYDKCLSPKSGSMIAIQARAKTNRNKVFSFNECHPRCSCNKDMCQNFLVAAQNKKRFKFLIKRIKKTQEPIFQMEKPASEPGSRAGGSHQLLNNEKLSSIGFFSSQQVRQISMWGLVAIEEIPAGAFLMEYLGEIVSKKQGDMRGTYYDDNGLSYLFDLNDLGQEDEKEQIIQKLFHDEFFPLCIDAMFYGNEARFINHSCDPNVVSFNLTGQHESNAYHSVGLFAQRKIMPGEELTLDYSWDKNILAISQDVPCLCGSEKCRGFLMRAKKNKKTQNAAKLESLQTSKLEDGEQSEMSVVRNKSSKIAANRIIKQASSPMSEMVINSTPPNNRKVGSVVSRLNSVMVGKEAIIGSPANLSVVEQRVSGPSPTINLNAIEDNPKIINKMIEQPTHQGANASIINKQYSSCKQAQPHQEAVKPEGCGQQVVVTDEEEELVELVQNFEEVGDQEMLDHDQQDIDQDEEDKINVNGQPHHDSSEIEAIEINPAQASLVASSSHTSEPIGSSTILVNPPPRQPQQRQPQPTPAFKKLQMTSEAPQQHPYHHTHSVAGHQAPPALVAESQQQLHSLLPPYVIQQAAAAQQVSQQQQQHRGAGANQASANLNLAPKLSSGSSGGADPIHQGNPQSNNTTSQRATSQQQQQSQAYSGQNSNNPSNRFLNQAHQPQSQASQQQHFVAQASASAMQQQQQMMYQQRAQHHTTTQPSARTQQMPPQHQHYQPQQHHSSTTGATYHPHLGSAMPAGPGSGPAGSMVVFRQMQQHQHQHGYSTGPGAGTTNSHGQQLHRGNGQPSHAGQQQQQQRLPMLLMQQQQRQQHHSAAIVASQQLHQQQQVQMATKHQPSSSSTTTTKNTSQQAMRPVVVNHPENVVPTLPPMSSTAANQLQLLSKTANGNASENKNGGILQGPRGTAGTSNNTANMGLVGGDCVPKLPSAKMLIKKALINNKGGNNGTGATAAAGPGQAPVQQPQQNTNAASTAQTNKKRI